jgi:hypothetical protein
LSKNLKKLKLIKNHIRDHYVFLIQNMAVITKKYRVLISFRRKLVIFGKTIGQHLWILSENLNFFTPHKNSYAESLCIIDLDYGVTVKKYGVFVSFCRKLVIFGKTVA